MKFGALTLAGAYGRPATRHDAEVGEFIDLARLEFCERALKVAQEYQRVGLSVQALRILDLLNLAEHGPDPKQPAIRAIKL